MKPKTFCVIVIIILKIKPKMNICKKYPYNRNLEHINCRSKAYNINFCNLEKEKPKILEMCQNQNDNMNKMIYKMKYIIYTKYKTHAI